MHFELLQSLLTKDTEKSIALCNESGDRTAVCRALTVYAFQQDVRAADDPSLPDVVNSAVQLLMRDRIGKSTAFYGELVPVLTRCRTVSYDTEVLRSAGATGVVSIHDLEEALAGDEWERVLQVVRDLSFLMDNRKYLFEVLTLTALRKSSNSVERMRHVWESMDTIGWQNHFAPFLLLHTLHALHADHTVSVASQWDETMLSDSSSWDWRRRILVSACRTLIPRLDVTGAKGLSWIAGHVQNARGWKSMDEPSWPDRVRLAYALSDVNRNVDHISFDD